MVEGAYNCLNVGIRTEVNRRVAKRRRRLVDKIGEGKPCETCEWTRKLYGSGSEYDQQTMLIPATFTKHISIRANTETGVNRLPFRVDENFQNLTVKALKKALIKCSGAG